MNNRDREYVHNRLADPVGNVLEAIGRLRQNGHTDLAARLMILAQNATDECREVLRELNSRR